MKNHNSQIKWLLTAIAIAGILTLIIVFFQFRQQQMRPLTIPDMAAKALMTMAKLHQTATKDGTVQWELDADSAQLEADTGKMILTAPQVHFFMEDGEIVKLTAEQGTLNTHTNDIQVTGNVRLRNDRYTLLTEVLDYEHERRMLTSDVPIQIKNKAFDLRANQMAYNLDHNIAQFDGQVEGILSEQLVIR